MRQHPSRRQFLAATAGVVTAAALPSIAAAPKGDAIAFYVIGDTHYLADKMSPTEMHESSAQVTGALIDTLNKLPGTEIPEAAGGGMVASPRGLIHAGDLIDSGDKAGGPYPEMHKTEWAAYEKDFGLTGSDGRLKCPVYEVHGNHDGPAGKGLVLDQIVARNKRRPGVKHVSANGLHYSWDWGDAHFVCLGIVVGEDKSVSRKRRYAPLDSLEFLVADLKKHVGESKRPVIITHHVDVARYTGPCDPDAPFDGKEWDPCDVHAFYEALKPYNVTAIFYGHTHVRNVFRWDGTGTKSAEGLAVFNTDNVSHFKSDTQAFFYAELADGKLTVREYQTKDRWQTGFWTPQVWRA